MKKSLALSVLSLLVASSALASPLALTSTFSAAVKSDVRADAGKTKYETLLDLYRAGSAARLSDFLNANLTCPIISKNDQDNTSDGTDLAVICSKILVAATPARDIPAIPARNIPAGPGPLLPARHEPGVPARHIPGKPAVCAPDANILVMGAPDFLDTITDQKLAAFSNRETGSDFVISVAKNDLGIYSDIGAPTTISIRKKDGTFPFIVETNKGIAYSGYCY